METQTEMHDIGIDEEDRIAIQNMQIKKIPSFFVEPLSNGENPLDCCESLFDDIKLIENKGRADVGSLACPHAYFLTMAVRDYDDFGYAFIREFIQNSNDAKSKKIQMIMDDGEKNDSWAITKRFTVKDDGCGMDKYTLFGRLLRFGATGAKPNAEEGVVGAFCKAKEALFFSWKKYCIVTNNLLVLGKGANFTVYELPPECSKKGTEVFLQLWDNNEWQSFFRKDPPSQFTANKIRNHVSDFMEYYEGKANITLNDQSFYKLSTKKRKFLESENFSIYYRKSKGTNYSEIVFQTGELPTKIESIYMGGNAKYDFVVNLRKPPYDCLTSNRDSLKNEAKEEYKRIISDLKEFSSGGTFKEDKETEDLVLYIPEKNKLDNQENQKKSFSREGEAEIGIALQCASNGNNNGIDTASLSCKNTEDSGKKQKVKLEPNVDVDFIYALFTGDKSTTLKNLFCSSQQRLVFAMSLWNEIIQKMSDANEKKNIYPGLIFSRKFNEEGGVGCHMAMNQNAGNILFLNPDKFKWNDFSLDGLLILTQNMLHLCSHEMAHVQESYHDASFCKVQTSLYRETINKNPQIIKELITFAQIILPKSKREEKMKQAKLC